MAETTIVRTSTESLAPSATLSSSQALSLIPQKAQPLLFRMFADPGMLAKSEKTDLVGQLREAVVLNPKSAELRVLYGMALCVNLDAHEAMEQFGEAVSLAPDSYIAHLKMGELWMRLRVCDKAQDHTRQASFLADNLAQAEVARRQAASIREMLRKGISRGGYSRSSWFALNRLRRIFSKKDEEPSDELATVAEIS
jgi:cytochrome c-type biogenesis protein CcmH/NrfG